MADITMNDTRQKILDTVDDLVGSLLYYDRKEDEELPRGAIDEAIAAGEITIDEIVGKFKECLQTGIQTND